MTAPTWDERMAKAGGRLLQDLCAGHGSYALAVYRFDYPTGGRGYLCHSCWASTYLRLGQPPQPLLTGAVALILAVSR